MAQHKPNAQGLIVMAILIVGIVIASLLVVFKPKAQKQAAIQMPPEVQVVTARAQNRTVPIRSQGTVEAKVRIQLAAEVQGKVVAVSRSLNSGEFFRQGDLLLRIDDSEYRLLITKAEAQVAAARQLLARTEAEAEQARFDSQRMGRNQQKLSAYALKEPHLKEARAQLKAAQADLAIAQLQHKRTHIYAPFDGRSVSKQVDVGQFVAPGSVLAEIYSIASAEVRIPLNQKQLFLLDLPWNTETELDAELSPRVTLTAHFAGQDWQWQAELVRFEGQIDARNRLLYAVVEVKQPYVEDPQFQGRPPLTAGMFVTADIDSAVIEQVFVLPRSALRFGRELWLLDEQEQLVKIPVEVLHKDQQSIYLITGLQNYDRVIISALDLAIDGMVLKPLMSNDPQAIEVAQ